MALLSDRQIQHALRYSEIGGGIPYQRKLTERDADRTVRTKAQFLEAVSGTTPRIVWVPHDVAIDLSGESFRATNKVIASDRGQNGSSGGLLYSTTKGINSASMNGGIKGGLMHLSGTSRLTGIRYRGPTHNYWSNPLHPGYLPYPPGDAAERRAFYNANHARGVKVHSDRVEIDNCEIWGWASAAIHIGSGSTAYDPEIHHNHIHDNMMTSAGYGVDIVKGRPWVHHNYFNAHRHAVDGFGFRECSFVVEDNVFGPSCSSHQVDMHGLHNNFSSARTNGTRSSEWWHGQAGGNMIVRRNTFMLTHVIPDATFDRGRPTWAVSIRGEPWPRNGSGIVIEKNRFAHNGPQSRNYGQRSFPNPAAYNQQVRRGGDQSFSPPTNARNFTANYLERDNQYNAPQTQGRDGYGAPVDLTNPPGPDDVGSDPGGKRPKDRVPRDVRRRQARALSETRDGLTDLDAILSSRQ